MASKPKLKRGAKSAPRRVVSSVSTIRDALEVVGPAQMNTATIAGGRLASKAKPHFEIGEVVLVRHANVVGFVVGRAEFDVRTPRYLVAHEPFGAGRRVEEWLALGELSRV